MGLTILERTLTKLSTEMLSTSNVADLFAGYGDAFEDTISIRDRLSKRRPISLATAQRVHLTRASNRA